MAWNKDEHDWHTRASGTYYGEASKQYDKIFEYNPQAGLQRSTGSASVPKGGNPIFPIVDSIFDCIPGWVSIIFTLIGIVAGVTVLSSHAVVGGILGAIAGWLFLPILRLGSKIFILLLGLAVIVGVLYLALRILVGFAN